MNITQHLRNIVTGITDILNAKLVGIPTINGLNLSPNNGENLIINSNGLINQRGYISGTATTVANQYTIDMFRVVTLGENLTFSIVAGITIFTAPSGGVDLLIENKNILGGSYVLSFSGTATAVISQSADNITYTTVTPVDGVYTITGGYYVRCRLSGGTFSKVKLEEGVITSQYYMQKYNRELSDCLRYLPSWRYGDGLMLSGQCVATTQAQFAFPFKVEPRVNPTGAIFSASTHFSVSPAAGVGARITTTSISLITFTDSVGIQALVASGLVQGQAALLMPSNALAKVLFTGCEL